MRTLVAVLVAAALVLSCGGRQGGGYGSPQKGSPAATGSAPDNYGY